MPPKTGYPVFDTPSPEVTESFCRVPSIQFSHNALVYSTNSPELVFGTVISKVAISRKLSFTVIILLKFYKITVLSLSFGVRIIKTYFPSISAFALLLGADLLYSGSTFPAENLEFSAMVDRLLKKNNHLRYSCQHSHFRYLPITMSP